MFEKLASAYSKETIKTAYEAHLKPLENQILILINHNKVIETNSNTYKEIANTARNWKIRSGRL